MTDNLNSAEPILDALGEKELKNAGRDKLNTKDGLGWKQLFYRFMGKTDTIPDYWSLNRDSYLRRFSTKNELLSGVIWQIASTLTGAQLRINPNNSHIEIHRKNAELYRRVILFNSEYGAGFDVTINKFIWDVLSTDNGGFMRVLSNGRWDKPAGRVKSGVVHMDSLRCTRTGIPEYPVVYQDGKDYFPIHATRLIDLSLMPDPDPDMHGVGHCPVGRSLDAVNRLTAIWEYYAQKVGAKSPKGFLVTENVNEESLADSIVQYETAADNADASLYAGLIPVTSITGQPIKLSIVSLANLPENFSEEQAIYAVCQLLGLQFGIDPNGIFRLIDTGGTKTSSVIEHVRNGGKLYNMLTEFLQNEITRKVLPPYLTCKYDADDAIAQELRANMEGTVAKTVSLLTTSGVIDVRTGRSQLLDKGLITPAEFEQMELNDGRTEGGENLIALLFSEDPLLKSLLSFDSVENILDVEGNDSKAITGLIQPKLLNAYKVSINSVVDEKRLKARQAIAVLETLLQMYQFGIPHWTLINKADNTLSKVIDVTQNLEQSRLQNETNADSTSISPKTEDVAVAQTKRDANSSKVLT